MKKTTLLIFLFFITISTYSQYLNGIYSSSTLRVDNSVIYTHQLEYILLVDGNTYHTDFIGAYHCAGQTPGLNTTTGLPTVELQGTSAGFDFTLIDTNILVPTQNLASTYSNEVRQNQAQYDASTVNLSTGLITIYYSIMFTGNTIERQFISTYTLITLETLSQTNDTFSYSPNPVKDVLNLNTGTSNIENYKIFTILGQEVLFMKESENLNQIDVSTLAKGTYILKLFMDDKVKNIKIIKD